MKTDDLTGMRFGRLTAIRRAEKRGRRTMWLWLCDCGRETTVAADKVKSGHTISCGCAWIEKCRKHGHGHDANGRQTKTYKAWVNMRNRTSGRYEQYDEAYASRGITVCERWQVSFENFLADMGECPPGKTLDRYPNNDGNYEPGNCQWATNAQQNRNMRSTRVVVFEGETMCLVDACKKAGIHPATVHHRLNIGMSVQDALLTPPIRRGQRKRPLKSLVLEYGSEWIMF